MSVWRRRRASGGLRAADMMSIIIPAQQIFNYFKNITEHKDINKIMMMLNSVMRSFRTDMAARLQQMNIYSFLWTEERDVVVNVRTSSQQPAAALLLCLNKESLIECPGAGFMNRCRLCQLTAAILTSD